uniref:Uncharacterized protein n=1 Tax=Vitis vinifera TaxID=29760 RepID=A5BJJ4_VITVI|nr:hypothetical protein VITISV_011355 [Vitis vinifera]
MGLDQISNPRLRTVLWNPWQRCPDRESGHTIRGRRNICYHPECDVHECRVLLLEGVRIALRRMSSWGIRMELIRIAWRHIRSPLRRPDISSGIMSDQTCPDPLIGYFTSGSPDAEWERRHFNFPGQAYPDLLIVLIQRASTADISDYPDFAQCRGVLLKLPYIFDRHFGIFCFRYLMSKSPNSPCNPPIIGFLSL